ncbi:MAG: aldehyde dehydrogenase family protein [Roseinatronobacter sp.]
MQALNQHFINGAWVNGQGPVIDVINPSTEDVCATLRLGTEAETNAAVAAAKAALPDFMHSDPAERLALVKRIQAAYKARAEEMAQAMSLEMGAPIDLARADQFGAGTWHIRNFITAFDQIRFIEPLNAKTPRDRIIREAVGVCALITPWNWPMNQITLKVIPALLAGCTVVLKPSEVAPLSAQVWTQVMIDAGTPPGVYNMVHGDGPGVGTQLSRHKDVDMVSFTGSTRAGIAISRNAAETLKRVHLELGGKGANLVFADADPDAVKRGVAHVMENSGQSCNAPTRMLVERSVYEQAVETARLVAEATRVGPAHLQGDHIGPVVSQTQFDRIQSLIAKGISEGARLVAGGLGRPEGMNRGYYVRPTVFADVTNDMIIAREEIFGPVLSILPFDSEDQAVAIANDTVYGLTNYVQSQDGARRNRLARRLRSGMVEMNGISRAAGAPFGGMKQSGNGREGGVWGIEDFLEVKAVSGWDPDEA